jgi:biotin carboxyl carrier protein
VTLRASGSASHDPGSPPIGESATLGFRLVVSPAAGRLRHLPPARFHEGEEWVSPGQPLARVHRGSVTVEVCSPVGGRMAGILARDGEPVVPGQPLVWVEDSSPQNGNGTARERT